MMGGAVPPIIRGITKSSEETNQWQQSTGSSLIKQVREETGAGMMDVKKALTEAEGDVARAKEIIRAKGIQAAGKREAPQGSGRHHRLHRSSNPPTARPATPSS